MKSASRRTLLVIILILLVVGATTYGFYPRAVEADLAAAERGTLVVTIEEEGRTRLKDRFIVTAPTAGYLQRVKLKVGDLVKQGQHVAFLEPIRSPLLDARSRAEAEAVVSAAEASVSLAREREQAATADANYLERRLERLKNLYEKGSIARDQLDQVEAEAKKARAVLLSAKAAVDVARSELARARTALKNYSATDGAARLNTVAVVSPVSGGIFRIYRESEGAVNVGEPLMEIGDVKNLEVRVDVLSSDAVKIKAGTNVIIKRWGGEGSLTGVVRIVEPIGFTKVSSLGVEEQRVVVIVDITSPPPLWRKLGDGYRLEAQFVVWEGQNVLQVPAGSLFRQGEDWNVFVYDQGRAIRRKVKLGQRNAMAAEIVSGLTENELVIVHPDDKIFSGTRIRPRK